IKKDRRALTSLVTSLPSGFFLIEVVADRGDLARLEFITATPGRYFYWHGGLVNFALPGTWYLPGGDSAFLFVDHLGGPLYLSRFDCASAASEPPPFTFDPTRTASSFAHHHSSRVSESPSHAIHVVSVRRVLVLPDESGRIQPLNVPDWSQWTRLDT